MPLGECDACGADLYDGVDHECPVTGSIVRVDDAGLQVEV
jgi:hypothetical protein